MAATGAAHAAEEHYTSTGLDNTKMAMWAFLGSECLFFGSLISTYMIYRGKGGPPFPNDVFDIPYTSVSAFVLLMSSLTMVLALSAIQRGNHRGLRIWISATALLGAIFVGGQFFEFTEFTHEGLGLTTNIFGSSFFVLTGFHGAHVTIGVAWLLSILVLSLRGGLPPEQALDVEIAGLYWHFVDIVWIVIFTLVYLVPYADGPEGTAEAAPHAFLRLVTVGERFLAALPF
jgi:cytochrome c oxidase subunit 3/cytochrome o ubiquinol oxidase subunit 3